MKTLCVVAHYFNAHSPFSGRSTRGDPEERKRVAERTVTQARSLPGTIVEVCGLAGSSLLPLDVTFHDVADPRFLIFRMLEYLMVRADEFDYVLAIEDDIFVPGDVPRRIQRFDRIAPREFCFHPNRMEVDECGSRCVDLTVWPGWKDEEDYRFEGQLLRVAHNPNSAFLCLSREKARYCRERVPFGDWKIEIGSGMASAFQRFHRPFRLYRTAENITVHVVVHLDHWTPQIAILNERIAAKATAQG